MADSFIQVAPDSTGKMMQTYLNTIGGNPVHAEAVSLVDSSGNPITTLPVSVIGGNINTSFGSNVNVNGTITATQGGIWNIGSVTTLPANTAFNLAQIAGTASSTDTGTAGPGTIRSILATNQTNIPVNVRAFQGAVNLGSGQVANVAATSTTIVSARATRRSVTIRNQDTANSGLIGPAPIGTANGLLLYPGDSVSVDFTGIIAGISSSSSNVTFGFLETYD